MPIGHWGEPVEDKEALDLALIIVQMHEEGRPLAEIVRVVALALAKAAQKEAQT